jgi:hypothetical protein
MTVDAARHYSIVGFALPASAQMRAIGGQRRHTERGLGYHPRGPGGQPAAVTTGV